MKNKFYNQIYSWPIILILFSQIYIHFENFYANCLDGNHTIFYAPEDDPKWFGVTKDVAYLFGELSYWNFNIWQLIEKKKDSNDLLRPMATIIFTDLEFFQKFNIDKFMFSKFMTDVEEDYMKKRPLFNQKNPFNNNYRAADILQTVYHFLKHTQLRTYLNDHSQLAIILAAIMCKYKHPGTDDTFERKRNTAIAQKYPSYPGRLLEKNAFEEAMKKINESKFLEAAPQITQHTVNFLMEKTIYHTALLHHDSDSKECIKLLRNPNDEPTEEFLLQWVLHVADLSYYAKPWQVYRKWLIRRSREFLRLYNYEKDLDEKPHEKVDMSLWNEESHDVAVAESQFISDVSIQMFSILEGLFDRAFKTKLGINNVKSYEKPWFLNLQQNKAIWNRIKRKKSAKK